MNENSNGRKKIWLYAAILFTSAFIVLLLTAYSQIKFNKNLQEFRNLISNGQSSKEDIQITLNSAMEISKKLSEENVQIKEQLNIEKKKSEDLSKQLDDEKSKYNAAISNSEKLSDAFIEYQNGNIVNCALILLKNCDINVLGAEGKKEYNELAGKTFVKAAESLYFEGYRDYLNKKYSYAIEKFRDSISLTSNEYFSDDCYYFMGYSEYLAGDSKLALSAFEALLSNYPDSTYKESVKEMLSLLK